MSVLKIPTKTTADSFLLQDYIDDFNALNAECVPHLGTTTNAGNVYSITSTEVIGTNKKFTIKFNANSAGAATLNISSIGSAKGIKKAGGLDAVLKIGIYTLFYDGVNFQLLGEGGDYGTAGAGQVLAPYTVGTDTGIVTGSIPDFSPNYTWKTPTILENAVGHLYAYTPPGYYGALSGLDIADPDFIAANFLATKNVFGLQGSIPLRSSTGGDGGSANWWSAYEVSAGDVGKVYLRPVANDGSIKAYQGDCWVNAYDANFIASNILATKSIFGLQGTIPVITPDYQGSILATSIMRFNAWGDGKNYAIMALPNNSYYSGINWIRVEQPDLDAANIPVGKTIFGVEGNGQNAKKQASGSTTTDGSNMITISGLNFIPSVIVISRSLTDFVTYFAGRSTGTYNISGTSQVVSMNGGYVSYGGFRLQGAMGAGLTTMWQAYE